MRQDVVDKGTDIDHLRLGQCVEIGRQVAGTEFQSRTGKELLDRMAVRHRFITPFVDVIIQKLAGQVTHQNGSRVGFRLDLVDEEVQRMMPVFPETGSQGTDINQIVRIDDDQTGDVMIFFVHPHIQQVQRHVFSQQILDVE